MALPSKEKLEKLQNFQHSQLLDVVDKLRERGLSSFLPLPQLIVCGDQSSGKSSVLEAISGVPFPKKDNLCTRFATEVVLRRGGEPEGLTATVSIIPGQDRAETDKLNLRNFSKSLTDILELPSAIQAAKEAMGLGSQGGNAFSTDVLRLEVNGPRMPQLTIVDLPGLIHSENKMQTAQDVELVSQLVQSYMAQPRSIILAVVSAKNDYANQIILKKAREEDPSGERTLGIITKPDTLHRGSESETAFVSLAKNQDVSFTLGWHVVRNLDSNGSAADEDRDEIEVSFFRESSWRRLNSSDLGASSLRKKLSDVLFNQISRELPRLMQEMEHSKQGCQDELKRLGRSRSTEGEQRAFLVELSQELHIICRAGCNGSYDHAFFGDTDDESNEVDARKFRSMIQNLSRGFARALSDRGAQWVISNETDLASGKLTREDAIEKVVARLQRGRGRELPGMYDPMIVSQLFQDYSSPWESIAQEYVNAIWQAAKSFLELLLKEFADETVCEMYQRHVLDREMDIVLRSAEGALCFLLEERTRHAATLNHYFTDNIAKTDNEKLQTAVIKHLQGCLVTDAYRGRSIPEDQISNVVSKLNLSVESDMDRYAAEEILDRMLAYYKVAMKRFLDNVPSLVIESFIIKHLLIIFEPTRANDMEASIVQEIAGESAHKRTHRESLIKKLTILNDGEVICKRYAHQAGGSEAKPSDTSNVKPQ